LTRAAAASFNRVKFDTAGAGVHADAFERLRSDALHGAVVHGVHSRETLVQVGERPQREHAVRQDRVTGPSGAAVRR
jgi:hypothetical protein